MTLPPRAAPPTSREEREALARLLVERERRRREAPLAYADLWHRDPPRTSQRRVAAELRPVTVALGGNRTGKTEAGAMLTAAHMLGGDHPHVVAWCARNGLDPSTIPRGPGRVCASALTSADSMRYQRAKLDKYLPAGTRWRNREGQGEATARAPNGGVIVCKSNDQGARSYQGDSWRLAWLDEEHDADVFREAQMRLLDQRGRIVLTMTPLLGLTWVYDLVQAGRADVIAHWLHMADNPHLPADEVQRILASYGPHERAARERGEFTALEGRVYGGWARHLHVVPAFDPPATWDRYWGIDFGTRNPCAVVCAALDPADDVLHVYRCYYVAERTISQHHAAWAGWVESGDRWPDMAWADPEDRGSRLTLASEHGFSTYAADKAIRAGINNVAERLAPDAEGRPHLVVHDHPSCAPLLREIEGYVWAPHVGGRDPDAPVKRNDHLMDALRYLCRGVERSSGLGASV